MSATDPSGKKQCDGVNRQVSIYSLAAAAAGVSILSLATPASAEVVITKAHLTLSHGQGLNLDLNHDGITDFSFSIFSYQDFSPAFRCTFNVGAVGGGAVVANHIGPQFYASALARGAKIGPSARFATSPSAIVERSFGDYVIGGHTTFRTLRGKWNNLQNRYLGLKFLIHGETHYGWIRLTVASTDHVYSISGTITAYAYETVPNKPILAGIAEKPTAEARIPEDIQDQGGPSLGMLALGAEGLPLWRRE